MFRHAVDCVHELLTTISYIYVAILIANTQGHVVASYYSVFLNFCIILTLQCVYALCIIAIYLLTIFCYCIMAGS